MLRRQRRGTVPVPGTLGSVGVGTEKNWNKMPAVAEVPTRVSGVQRVPTADSAGLPRMNRRLPGKEGAHGDWVAWLGPDMQG